MPGAAINPSDFFSLFKGEAEEYLVILNKGLLHLEKAPLQTEVIATDQERLTASGFSSEEVVSLLWLQQWYQKGGSDRVTVLRHWEFLKLLVLTGKLDL